MFFNLN